MLRRKLIINLLLFFVVMFFLAAVSPAIDEFGKRVSHMKKDKKLVSFHPENSRAAKDTVFQSKVIALGKKVFNDNIVSRDNNISCGSCHLESKGFTNGESFGTGTHGNKTKRNVPHLYNLEMNSTFFWDGRATNLEEQLVKVLTSKDELDMTFKELITRMNNNKTYEAEFEALFPGTGISKATLTKAIVSYEKSIRAADSPFDKFLDGDTTALTTNQKRGLGLFITKANCIACHKGANLSDGLFHNVGLKTSDIGRGLIDKIGMSKEFESTPYPFFSTFKAFRTPTLRNVKKTAPYFHDGSKKTLREVVESYNKGGDNEDKTGIAKEIIPLNLEEEEIEALTDFLGALTSDVY